MQLIHSKHTMPELRVRSILHRMGFRFRLHRRDIPGTPDIVLVRHRTIILVNGCFWHQHPGCKFSQRPKSRQEFWNNKLDRNIARDRDILLKLKAGGWRVLIIWECQVLSKKRSEAFMEEFIRESGLSQYRRRERYIQLSIFGENDFKIIL